MVLYLLLAACGGRPWACGGRSGERPLVAPTEAPPSASRNAATVTGRVLARANGDQRPLAGVTVAVIGEKQVVTDKDGRFRYDALPPRYDLVVLVPSPLFWGEVPANTSTERSGVSAYVFHDVTRRDLTVRVDVSAQEQKRSALVKVIDAGPYVSIAIVGDHRMSSDSGDWKPETYATWYGPADVDATVHAVSFDATDQDRLPTSYRGIGTAKVRLTDGKPSEVRLPMQPVATRKLHVDIEDKDSAGVDLEVALEPARSSPMKLAARPGGRWSTSQNAIDLPVPAASFPLFLSVRSATPALDNWSTRSIRLPAGASAAKTRLPPRVVANVPSKDQRFDHSTPIGWTGKCGVAIAGINVTRTFEDKADTAGTDRVESYYFRTTRSEVTIPDLRAFGARLPKGSPMLLRVDCNIDLPSVDVLLDANDQADEHGASSLTENVTLKSVDKNL